MKESSKRGEYKGPTEARRRAVKKFREQSADRVELLLPRGEKQIIKDHAEAAGQSMNAYIIQATRKRMKEQDESAADQTEE